ncbi:N-acetylmuramic acid 6-phosphate etherase [Skermanella aerolata]|uniref:N-acetylmuramic acid 6-phosphate etherase n=1 Tax=Skermanella aerolata TaxID=393310 RepID=UPI003D1933AF
MPAATEAASERFQGLDQWKTTGILEALWAGQSRAVAACLPALPAIERAVEDAAARLGSSGRLIYVGAGSSGLIAALDALELASTFDWPDERLAIVLAGGLDFSRGLDSGTEDDPEAARTRMRGLDCTAADVVIGVSASGTSRFTVAALEEARQAGAGTMAVACNAGSALLAAALHPVLIETGAEVIGGSTRLGAGTAQKLVLNLFSTALMVRLGAVFDNLMVNVRPENEKLRQRCVAMVARIAGCGPETAADAIARTGSVKLAVLALAGVDGERAGAALGNAGGNLRKALGTCPKPE